jgi:short-subunit dehydrogenase
MRHIVITGSSRGIGFGLAKYFLLDGQRVTVSGRNTETVDQAVQSLSEFADQSRITGFACDVQNPDAITALWEQAASVAPVDIWINNAGVAQPFEPLTELSETTVSAIVDTNIKGLINASRIVVNKIKSQGYGALYNMEGFGSDGRTMANMAVYGTSKRAVNYFTKALAKEYRDHPVTIGTIRPGMVVTGLLTGQLSPDSEHYERSIRVFNTLADTVDTVSPYIVRKILKNRKKEVHIRWLTGGKVMLRFVRSMFSKRKVEGIPTH